MITTKVQTYMKYQTPSLTDKHVLKDSVFPSRKQEDNLFFINDKLHVRVIFNEQKFKEIKLHYGVL